MRLPSLITLFARPVILTVSCPSDGPRYSASTRQLSVRRSTDLADRVVAFLRARYPVKTVENVAADTGLGAKAIAKWIERSSAPSGPAIRDLTIAYGTSFLVAILPRPPKWLEEAERHRQIAEAEEVARRAVDALERLRGRA